MKKIAITLSLIVSVSGTQLKVPSAYSTIQAGLNAASSGDTVLVAAGTYKENIIWPNVNGIKLISAGDSSNTIIDGNQAGSVIKISYNQIDSTTVISGFTITGGGSTNRGGGIALGGSPKITKTNINYNSANSEGGGLHLQGSSPLIIDVTIHGNVQNDNGGTVNNGGGICMSDGSSPLLKNVIISKNSSQNAGGMFISYDSNPTLENVIISHNTNEGIYLWSSSLKIKNVKIAHNGGYGIKMIRGSFLPNCQNLIVENNNYGLYINTGYFDNGIFTYKDSNTELSNISFLNNNLAFTVTGESSVSFKKTTIHANYNRSAENSIIFDEYHYFQNNQSSIELSNIVNNSEFKAKEDLTFSATNNYWGHISGPENINSNPNGKGNLVSSNFIISPWLEQPNVDAPPIPANQLSLLKKDRQNGEISMQWNYSKMNDLAGYIVHYGNIKEYPLTNSIDNQMDTTFTINLFYGNDSIHFAVSTYDLDGNHSGNSRYLLITNEAPLLTKINKKITSFSRSPLKIPFETIDKDGDNITYDFTSSDQGVAVKYNSTSDSLVLTPDISFFGDVLVTVIASDELLTDTSSFMATFYRDPSALSVSISIDSTITPTVTTFAGNGLSSWSNGNVTEASFGSPRNVAVDGIGNVYVADRNNNEIRKISLEGSVTTLAGKNGYAGLKDGLPDEATFDSPHGVAVDKDGYVYVADWWNHAIRKITPEGVVATLAGSRVSGHEDGIGNSAKFFHPTDIAVDLNGNIYVAEGNGGSNYFIRKITPEGVVTTLAGSGVSGHEDGMGSQASFAYPVGITVDAFGNIYVADRNNGRIRKISPIGEVTTIAGKGANDAVKSGFKDGIAEDAVFDSPSGIAVDEVGNVYIADTNNRRIRKIDNSGIVSTLAGNGDTEIKNGSGVETSFVHPMGLAVDGNGNIFVAERNGHVIRKISTRLQSGATVSASSIKLLFTTSKPFNDFNLEDIIIDSGRLSNFLKISEIAYAVDFTPTVEGNITIKVASESFSDTNGKTNIASNIFELNVVNNPPVLDDLNDVKFDEDNQYTLQLKAFDADGDPIEYNATSDNNSINLTVITDSLNIVPQPNWYGEANIIVYASDGMYSDTSNFQLTIDPVSDIASVQDVTIDEDKSADVTLSSTFTGTTTFTAVSDTNAVTISVSSSILTLTPNANWHGVANIKAYASDGTSKDSTSFKLTVTPVQDAPTAFEWVSSALDTVNITQDNLETEYIVDWTASTDVDGDSINYLLYAKIGVNPPEEIYDTTSTSVQITYEEFLENVFEPFPMLPRVTVQFSMEATDGIDTVKITGDNRVLFVNRYEYLSTVSEGIPTEFALHENYPNPFNPTTTLRFDLPEVSDITLTIYNMLGQKVRTFNYQNTSAGYHSVTWDATNDLGQQVGAGVYLYQLLAKDFVKTRKMVLLK